MNSKTSKSNADADLVQQLKGSGSTFEYVIKVYPDFLNDLKKRVIQHILGVDEQKKNPEKEALSLKWIRENAKNVFAAEEFVKKNSEHVTGYDAAKELIDKNNEHDVQVWHTMGRIDKITFDEFFPESSSIDESPFDDIINILLDEKSLKLDDNEYINVYAAIEEIEEVEKVFSETQKIAEENFRRLVEQCS